MSASADRIPYTVLLLRPDTQWDGHESDWIARFHVEAGDIKQAVQAAIAQFIADEAEDDGPEFTAEDVATLAVYEGHHRDLYDNARHE